MCCVFFFFLIKCTQAIILKTALILIQQTAGLCALLSKSPFSTTWENECFMVWWGILQFQAALKKKMLRRCSATSSPPPSLTGWPLSQPSRNTKSEGYTPFRDSCFLSRESHRPDRSALSLNKACQPHKGDTFSWVQIGVPLRGEGRCCRCSFSAVLTAMLAPQALLLRRKSQPDF